MTACVSPNHGLAITPEALVHPLYLRNCTNWRGRRSRLIVNNARYRSLSGAQPPIKPMHNLVAARADPLSDAAHDYSTWGIG